jgi:hypothetical protein
LRMDQAIPMAQRNNLRHFNELAWLGRQDSNLGMAESKSTCFFFCINAYSEKTLKFGPILFNPLASISECMGGAAGPDCAAPANAAPTSPHGQAPSPSRLGSGGPHSQPITPAASETAANTTTAMRSAVGIMAPSPLLAGGMHGWLQGQDLFKRVRRS